jgi:hypothetical protein
VLLSMCEKLASAILYDLLTSSILLAAAPPFFFFAFIFFFPLLRSLFFNQDIPNLQTSAYLMKKKCNAFGSTTVDNLIFCVFRSFDFPSVARTMIGRGFVRFGSGNGLAGSIVGCASRPSLCATSIEIYYLYPK